MQIASYSPWEHIEYVDAKPGKHTHTLIYFHGLSDTASAFKSRMFIEGGPFKFDNLRVVMPSAHKKYTTCDKKQYTSWFDIFKLENHLDSLENHPEDNDSINLFDNKKWAALNQYIHNVNQTELVLSSDAQLQLVEEEAARLNGNYSKILIGGFSQGSVVTLTSLLRFKGPQPLGGALALSGELMYDQANEILTPEAIKRIQKTPLFLYIGEKDQLFKPQVAEFSYQPLKNIYDAAEGSLKQNYLFQTQANLNHLIDVGNDPEHLINGTETYKIKEWIQQRIE